MIILVLTSESTLALTYASVIERSIHRYAKTVHGTDNITSDVISVIVC